MWLLPPATGFWLSPGPARQRTRERTGIPDTEGGHDAATAGHDRASSPLSRSFAGANGFDDLVHRLAHGCFPSPVATKTPRRIGTSSSSGCLESPGSLQSWSIPKEGGTMATGWEGGWEGEGDRQKSSGGGQAMGTPSSSLAEERRDLTRCRIRQAAMEVIAQRGFNATVEEIAQRSGVSPRTIFRHYATHDRLIAAT